MKWSPVICDRFWDERDAAAETERLSFKNFKMNSLKIFFGLR